MNSPYQNNHIRFKENNSREQPLTQIAERKMHFLNLDDLTNQHIHERALATWLIQHGEPVENVATKLSVYDDELGEFLWKVIEQNRARKRWGTKKNAYMTWTDPFTWEIIKNPNEYLEKISQYITTKINSKDWKEWHTERTEMIPTLFGISQKTQGDLIALFLWN